MLDFHPAANLFPLLEGAEYESLKADIEANGLMEPIVLDSATNTILDGRNRYRACRELGIDYTTTAKFYDGDPVGFVVSLNLHRRHLSTSQRDMVAAKIANMKQGARTDLAQNCATSQAEAAELLNTSRRGVQQAVSVLQVGTPALISAVEQDIIPVSAAATLAKASPATQAAVLEKIESGKAKTAVDAMRIVRKENRVAQDFPEGKYRVLYADPPWDYSNSGLGGSAAQHYPTMSMDDLCALPVAGLAAENAVLFLWVTAPQLPNAFPLMKAWGFEYKASFIWDKVKHNFGHYNSVRHELLLIATRGSCLPDADTLLDSVVELARTDKHSEKPEEFRQIIDVLYPHGPRIELFARTSAEGWEAWGNELPDVA